MMFKELDTIKNMTKIDSLRINRDRNVKEITSEKKKEKTGNQVYAKKPLLSNRHVHN